MACVPRHLAGSALPWRLIDRDVVRRPCTDCASGTGEKTGDLPIVHVDGLPALALSSCLVSLPTTNSRETSAFLQQLRATDDGQTIEMAGSGI